MKTNYINYVYLIERYDPCNSATRRKGWVPLTHMNPYTRKSSVYRPVPGKWSYAHPGAINPADPYKEGRATTQFHEGDRVIISNREQSPFCAVRREEVPLFVELWHSHGIYFREDSPDQIIPSDEVWAPKEK